MLFKRDTDIRSALRGILEVSGNDLEVIDADELRQRGIDRLVYNALFHESDEVRYYLSWLIREAAAKLVIYPSTIRPLYELVGRSPRTDFTTPAFCIRALTYDAARASFRAAEERAAGTFVFELRNGAMGYSLQPPLEYATCVLAAAIKERYQGPIFLQINARVDAESYAQNRDREIEHLKALIEDAINAGFLNIDIDTASLVDLSQPTFYEQQRPSYAECAELAAFAWQAAPATVPISIGAEFSNVDDRGRAAEHFRTFADGFTYELHDRNDKAKGLSKVTVSPRVTPTPEAGFAATESDLATVADIGEVARREYAVGGVAVRSTEWAFPQEDYSRLRLNNISELHLETRFEDAVLDHEAFSASLKEDMYHWVDNEFAEARWPGESDERFYYRIRSKALGPFQRAMWDLPAEQRLPIMQDVQARLEAVLDQLNVTGTAALVRDTVAIQEVKLPAPISGYKQTAEATLDAIIASMEVR